MNNDLILNMALNTNLLPEDLSAAILAGNMPPLETIVMELVVGAIDAHAVTINDPQAKWLDRRLARTALAGVFLAAMAVLGRGEE